VLGQVQDQVLVQVILRELLERAVEQVYLLLAEGRDRRQE
jgi:hypothetical protein